MNMMKRATTRAIAIAITYVTISATMAQSAQLSDASERISIEPSDIAASMPASGEGILAAGSEPALGGGIVCPADAPANVKLAAKEIRRYVYLRTGTLLFD